LTSSSSTTSSSTKHATCLATIIQGSESESTKTNPPNNCDEQNRLTYISVEAMLAFLYIYFLLVAVLESQAPKLLAAEAGTAPAVFVCIIHLLH